jgi:pyruvate decarboxylase
VEEATEFVKATGLPVFATPMGKGGIDETLPNYGGVYAGSGSNAGVAARVESSDLVLSLGAIKSDFNTAGFSYNLSQLKTIDFHSYTTKVRYSEYPGVRMNGVLKKLTQKLKDVKLNIEHGSYEPNNDISKQEEQSSETAITHAWLWPRLGQWLQPGDVVTTETGTSNFGIWETRFPKDVKAISQVLWGSIGYATGAAQGAALASKERGIKRSILWTGDGSFQLTAQAVSDMLRNKLSPYIFVICNDGYTIERYIHGWDAVYNDVQPWRYKDLPAAFGGKSEEYETYAIKTRDELDKLFNDEAFSKDNGKLRFVEVYMPKEDAPNALKMTAESAAKRNA